MTTHAELSKQLALALGYCPESVRVVNAGTRHALCRVFRLNENIGMNDWAWFDYRDPAVAMPLLQWLAPPYGSVTCWPNEESWTVFVIRRDVAGKKVHINANTLEEAIARAVIAIGGE